MLYSFRKSLKKWKLVLWPVAISIAASSVMMIRRSVESATIARVNGESISYRSFTARLREFQEQAQVKRQEARSRGIPAELYLQFYGLSDPTQAALDAVVYKSVQDAALDPLWIRLHDEVVSTELLKSLPTTLLDASGNVDVALYRHVIQQHHMRIAEFEDRREEDMVHELFDGFVRHAAYVSRGQQRKNLEESLLKKSFYVATVEASKVRREVTEGDLSNAELESYYETNKEQYRVPEKRTFAYWVVSPSVAEERVAVSDDAVRQYYEKNKNTVYRVAPRVKVRHILIATDTENARSLAESLREQIAADATLFEKLAQEHSADKETAKVGGVRDFFSRGTYDKAFEQAAFRLRQPGDLAPVVKTDAGFEIIQLVERIPASEKAFEEVRGEIESTMRAKAAADWIRTHLEKIKKDAVNNQEAIKEITGAAGASKELKDVEESKANSHTLDGLIVKNGFTLHALESYSFFNHSDAYVLVQLTGKEVSYIKPYKEVLREVEKDLVEVKVGARVKEIAREIAASVRGGKTLAESVLGHRAVSCKTTDCVSSASSDSTDFKSTGGFLKKCFPLAASGQVVLHFSGNDAYLATLHEVDQESLKDVELALSKAAPLEDQVSQESSVLAQAFTSSLLRNAHVDFDQKLLGSGLQREEPIPYDI